MSIPTNPNPQGFKAEFTGGGVKRLSTSSSQGAGTPATIPMRPESEILNEHEHRPGTDFINMMGSKNPVEAAEGKSLWAKLRETVKGIVTFLSGFSLYKGIEDDYHGTMSKIREAAEGNEGRFYFDPGHASMGPSLVMLGRSFAEGPICSQEIQLSLKQTILLRGRLNGAKTPEEKAKVMINFATEIAKSIVEPAKAQLAIDQAQPNANRHLRLSDGAARLDRFLSHNPTWPFEAVRTQEAGQAGQGAQQ